MRAYAFVFILAIGGCASVQRGTDEVVSFRSEPADARVALSNGMSCPSTPCDLTLPRKDEFTATFTKDGFHDESIVVTSHTSANAPNILLSGGLVGAAVDTVDGARLDHDPNPVVVRLKRDVPAPRSRRRAEPTS